MKKYDRLKHHRIHTVFTVISTDSKNDPCNPSRKCVSSMSLLDFRINLSLTSGKTAPSGKSEHPVSESERGC